MIRSILFGAVSGAILASALPARAADSWGIEHEEIARVKAKVVDLSVR